MMDVKVLDVLTSMRLLFSFALRFFPFRPVGASSPWLAGAFDGVLMSVASSPAPGVRRSRVVSAKGAGPPHGPAVGIQGGGACSTLGVAPSSEELSLTRSSSYYHWP